VDQSFSGTNLNHSIGLSSQEGSRDTLNDNMKLEGSVGKKTLNFKLNLSEA